MSSETYAIVFKGGIVEGFEPAAVQAQLSRLLKTDAKKTAALFSGKQIVLKKTTDKAAAAKYGKALKKVGADVKIKIIKSDEAKSAPAAPATFQAAEAPTFAKADPPAFQAADDAPVKPAASASSSVPSSSSAPSSSEPAPAAQAAESAPNVDISGISLAPNEGDLFDPTPEPEALDLDLSNYSVAENDGSLLVEPSEDVVVELDLSEFSVAENDGRPLIEPSEDTTPKVEAPDFGLDEPGAVLETLKVEQELLNPNTMGMSIAMAGTDLLEDDEKPQAPPPQAPDTSKINLVPNFDI